MQVLFVLFLLFSSFLLGNEALLLKNQQPNWKIQICDEYQNGMPARVELFAPKPKSQDWEQVKERKYRPDGTLISESDLAEGIKQGATILYYPSEKIWTLAWYEKGKLEGLYRTFDEQGVLRDQFHYQADILEGPYELFDAKGKTFEKGRYSKGKKDGEVRLFSDTEALIRRENYSEGLLHGESTDYYPNGNRALVFQFYRGLLHGNVKNIAAVKYSQERKITEEQDFRMGQPWGVYRTYDAKGNLLEKSHVDTFPKYTYEPSSVKNSLPASSNQTLLPAVHPVIPKKKEGKIETFYENGNKRSSLEYKNGLLDGEKLLWAPDGTLVEEAYYIKGNLEGRYYSLESNGALKIAQYKNNQLHGLFELTHPPHEFFGKMKALESHYDEGLLHGNLIEYNTAGTKISQIPYKQGVKEGKALWFTDQGQLFRSSDFQNDQLHGKYEEFYPNGVVKSEVSYTDGVREGVETHYFDDGAIKSTTFFAKGLLHGPKKEWDRDGRLIYQGNFHQGGREGLFRRYDESGHCIKENRFHDDIKGLK